VVDGAAIAERLAAVRARIDAAAHRANRLPESVTLVGASKRKGADAILAALRAGLRDFGENYVQEGCAKIAEVRAALEGLSLASPRWHFIGHLQRNKVRDVVRDYDVVETLDRESLGDALDRRAAGRGRPLEALIQVNVSREPQKSGAAPEEVPALLARSAGWENLRVTGLMAIPAAGSPEATRADFARMRALFDTLRSEPGGEQLRELSMGMSSDFETAIEEGATIVRVGTAIFGAREEGDDS
jgi:pyridoxal phosphate enzyme (YggS family)